MGGWRAAVEGGGSRIAIAAEDDFVGEERDPFEGGRVVGGGAPDESVPAVGMAEQLGLAEAANERAGGGVRNERFHFHDSTLAAVLGQRLSKGRFIFASGGVFRSRAGQ